MLSETNTIFSRKSVYHVNSTKTLGVITLTVSQKTASTSQKVHSLNDSSKSIQNIVVTIQEIADRTNLLALNATS
nr:methyl-accepting chemotaxis protein [Vibrio cyclitrophicus]